MGRWVVCGVAQERDECGTLRLAARLADHVGARLAIVTVIPEPADSAELRDALGAARYTVASVARRCSVADDAVHHVEVGDPVDGLHRVAEHLDAELVVIGGQPETSRDPQAGRALIGARRRVASSLSDAFRRPVVIAA